MKIVDSLLPKIVFCKDSAKNNYHQTLYLFLLKGVSPAYYSITHCFTTIYDEKGYKFRN